MKAAEALSAWRELNDRQQGTLAVIFGVEQDIEETRRIEAARGNWSKAPASQWRRIDFSHDPSDRRAFGTTDLQRRLSYRGWDNQGNGSTMAALAARGLIRRSTRPTTFGVMHMVTMTPDGRAVVKAGTSLSPAGSRPKPALGERAWEVLAMLWACDLRGEALKWYNSKTIDKVLIGKHIPPLAEKRTSSYAITDRGKWFYREHYATHVGAYPDVRALHPAGAAAEPWPAQADAVLKEHYLRHHALCAAWQDAYAAQQAAQAEADREQPAAWPALPESVAAQIAERHLLWQKTAQQRVDLADAHLADFGQRCERAAREYAAAALNAFAAAVAGTDPLAGLRPPSDTDDGWDEPPLPRPPEVGIEAIDDRAAKLHAAAVGKPRRRRGPAPTHRRGFRPAERPSPPGGALADLAGFLRSHVDDGALRRRVHGG